jgi:hypothetical protein
MQRFLSRRANGAFLVLTVVLSACSGGGKKGGGGAAGSDGGAPEVAFGVTVSDANARACEVVLTEGTRDVTGVTFGAGVKGQWSRWAPRVAIAFTSTTDAPLGTAATLTLRVRAPEAKFPGQSVTCYDRAGAKLAKAEVTIK